MQSLSISFNFVVISQSYQKHIMHLRQLYLMVILHLTNIYKQIIILSHWQWFHCLVAQFQFKQYYVAYAVLCLLIFIQHIMGKPSQHWTHIDIGYYYFLENVFQYFKYDTNVTVTEFQLEEQLIASINLR